MDEGFQHIQGLLERYKNVSPSGEGAILLFVKYAAEAGVFLSPKNISLSGGVMRVHTTPARKHTLFMHKEKIIGDLTKELGVRSVRDIR